MSQLKILAVLIVSFWILGCAPDHPTDEVSGTPSVSAPMTPVDLGFDYLVEGGENDYEYRVTIPLRDMATSSTLFIYDFDRFEVVKGGSWSGGDLKVRIHQDPIVVFDQKEIRLELEYPSGWFAIDFESDCPLELRRQKLGATGDYMLFHCREVVEYEGRTEQVL